MNGDSSVKLEGLKLWDETDLWGVENIAGPGVGIITVHTKVDIEGAWAVPITRKYFSAITTAFHGQPISIQFEIPASDLKSAIANWQAAAEKAAHEQVEAMESQYQRSRLAMPAMASMTAAGKVN